MAKWRCAVCGYEHEGESPPAECPLCGTDRSKFASADAGGEAADSDAPLTQEDQPSAENRRWQCAVCGYIHTGPEPPDQCPVCGVDRSHFSEIEAEPATQPEAPATEAATADQTLRWQCVICGYIHTGPEPPAVCPVCGADRSKFVLLEEPEEAAEAGKQDTAPPEDQPVTETPWARRLLDPYKHWIDLSIEYHAHPIAVHVPNGVLPITVAMVLLAALFDWPAMGMAAVYNMGFIALSMPAVLFTGYLHWQYKFGGNLTDTFKWKIICAGTVTVLSLLLFVWGLLSPETAQRPSLLYLLVYIIDLGFAGVAGWLGGKLVFHPGK